MRQRARWIAVVALAAASALWLPAAALAAPPNDDFADAIVLEGALPIAGVAGSNVGATRQSGEPGGIGPFAVEPAGRSVWYRWTATSTGWVTVDTCGSGFDTMLDVYEGPLPGPVSVVRSREGPRADCGPGGTQVTWQAQEGSTYSIRVDGSLSLMPPDATEGAFALELARTPTPANDSFGNAQAVTSMSFENDTFFRVDVPGFNWNATKEAGEPAHRGDPGGASVWYSWTAPATGKASVVVVSSAFSTQLGESDRGLLGVYSGDSIAGLTPVGAPGYTAQEAKLDVTAGATYRIAVDGRLDSASGRPTMGGFDFLIYLTAAQPPPPLPDTTAPRTTMAKRSIKPGRRKATFRFRSNEAGGAFRCRLDRRKARACASPKSYTGLAPGSHTFRVYAIDAAGNSDASPALAHFSIPRPRRSRG